MRRSSEFPDQHFVDFTSSGPIPIGEPYQLADAENNLHQHSFSQYQSIPAGDATATRLQQLQNLQRQQLEILNHLQRSQQQQRHQPQQSGAVCPTQPTQASQEQPDAPRSFQCQRKRQYEAAAVEMVQRIEKRTRADKTDSGCFANNGGGMGQFRPLQIPQLSARDVSPNIPIPATFKDGSCHAVLSPLPVSVTLQPPSSSVPPCPPLLNNGDNRCSSGLGKKMWQKLLANDVAVKGIRARTRKKIEQYLATCMPSKGVATNVPFCRLLAAQLERKLYDTSASFEQYSDASTFEARLKILAMQIGKRIEANQSVSPVGAGGGPARLAKKRQRSGEFAAGVGGGASAEETKRCSALRSHLGSDKYDELMHIVREVRQIRRTSDVWMCAKAANRRTTSGCGDGNTKRRKITFSSLKEAAAISCPHEPSAADELDEPSDGSEENVLEACDDNFAAGSAVARPESPEEKTLVQSMPRALTAIYFSTRLVEAEAALRMSHGGSSPQLKRRVQCVEWDSLLEEARRNLRAFRALEEEAFEDGPGHNDAGPLGGGTEKDRRLARQRRFQEVCTLSGGCRTTSQ